MEGYMERCIHLKACRRVQAIGAKNGHQFARHCDKNCTAYVDEKELAKALDYDRGQYQQGEWDMFELISSAWYGKQMYFREMGGMVYSRVTCKTMQQDEAVNEFLEMIGE